MPLKEIDTIGLLAKMQIKSGKICIINAPIGFPNFIGVESEQEIGFLFFCHHLSDVSEAALLDLLPHSWFAYKKNDRSEKLNRDHGWEPLLSKDWMPVRQISISDTWSALRFKYAKTIEKITRNSAKKGVDPSTRRVDIPQALNDELKAQNLLSLFQSQTYTFRKEAVLSWSEAVKSETKIKRLNQIITDLSSKK